MKRDYYEVLGISKDAGDSEIKRAYRRLAMEYHPDRKPDDKEAESLFKEAAEAYQILSDPEKRQRYDRFGHQGMNGGGAGFQGGFSNFQDIFSAFGDMFGGAQTISGEDIQLSIKLPFLEAAHGTQKEIEVKRHVRCELCKGSGAKPGTSKTTCSTCKGHGQVAHRQGFFTIATECQKCHGQGVIIQEKCPTCRGSTLSPLVSKVTVQVPAGVDDGTRLRMSGLGDEPAGHQGPPGDLYILFQVEPDARFQRQGDDVYIEVPLSIPEATLGTTATIPTLDGEEQISIPAGTQPMEEQVLKKRGIPNVRGHGKGNLIVRFIVHIPKKLSTEAQQLMEELSSHLGTPVSKHASKKDGKESTFHRLFRGKKK